MNNIKSIIKNNQKKDINKTNRLQNNENKIIIRNYKLKNNHSRTISNTKILQKVRVNSKAYMK